MASLTKSLKISGESGDAIGVGNAHPRGHQQGSFCHFLVAGHSKKTCAEDDLARATAGKVAKHAEGKIYRNLLEPLRPKVYNLPLICIERT